MALDICRAVIDDYPFLAAHDRHVRPEELETLLRQGRILLLRQDGERAAGNYFCEEGTDMKLIKLRDHPELKNQAAGWFHEKWGIPLEAYTESMDACLRGEGPVPQWYVMLKENRILGGLGVIENDFHNRKDLAPNVCAVYVEEDCRCRGIAGTLLDFVCRDMAAMGISTLYLITDHTSFYERYGWEFLCMVQGDGEPEMTRMYIHREGTHDENCDLHPGL